VRPFFGAWVCGGANSWKLGIKLPDLNSDFNVGPALPESDLLLRKLVYCHGFYWASLPLFDLLNSLFVLDKTRCE